MIEPAQGRLSNCTLQLSIGMLGCQLPIKRAFFISDAGDIVMMKILFLAANPKNSSPLRLAGEQRDIQQKLESTEQRADLQLNAVFAARPDDLLLQMNRIRPQILHFSGHGAESGEIIMETESGEPKAVSPGALKAVFEAFRPELQVVVLNSCYSATQANAFVEIVEAVIAMSNAVDDRSAVVFAAAFYRALGFGRSIADAFKQGTTALLLEGVGGADIPVLLHKNSSDPSKLTVDSSQSLSLSVDPEVPERLRRLLQQGTRLVIASTPQGKAVYFELVMRQSRTTYVALADSRATISSTAEALAQAIVPQETWHQYAWELTRPNGGGALAPFHTLEMAGVQSEDKLLLVGNAKQPQWQPQQRQQQR